MRIYFLTIVILLIGCNRASKTPVSFWEAKRDSFPLQGTKVFVSDSTLRANYQKYPKVKSGTFDSLFSYGDVYLHSWQQRDLNKNEFTVVKDDGELGLKIFYFVCSKTDSVISATHIAGKGSEGGYWFESISTFIAPDTLYSIGAITQWLDFETLKPIKKTKGDSTFYHLIFDKEGQFKKVELGRNLELNLEKDLL